MKLPKITSINDIEYSAIQPMIGANITISSDDVCASTLSTVALLSLCETSPMTSTIIGFLTFIMTYKSRNTMVTTIIESKKKLKAKIDNPVINQI